MEFQKGRALIIGVGNYQHAHHLDVEKLRKDVTSLREVLSNPDFCGYQPERVKLLVDQTATLEAIRLELQKLVSAQPDETVLIYYTGHGMYDTNGKYCLTAHDTRLESKKVAPETALSDKELLDMLRLIPAERLLLIFNSCHSGEISPALGEAAENLGGVAVPTTTSEAILSSGKGRMIITACGEDQYSYIGRGPMTIFAQALVDGLQGKGITANAGYVSIYDLYVKVYEYVKTAVEKLGLIQHPELTVLKGVGPFPVALFKGAAGSLGDFDAAEVLPEEAAVREVDEKRAQKMFQKITRITVGGSYIAGDVNISGGDFVGRDKISYGDSYSMNVPGGISGSTVIVGKGNQVTNGSGENAAQHLDGLRALRALVAEIGPLLAGLPLDAFARMGIDLDFKMVEMLLAQTRPAAGMLAGRLNSLAAGLRAAGGAGAAVLVKVEQAAKMAERL